MLFANESPKGSASNGGFQHLKENCGCFFLPVSKASPYLKLDDASEWVGNKKLPCSGRVVIASAWIFSYSTVILKWTHDGALWIFNWFKQNSVVSDNHHSPISDSDCVYAQWLHHKHILFLTEKNDKGTALAEYLVRNSTNMYLRAEDLAYFTWVQGSSTWSLPCPRSPFPSASFSNFFFPNRHIIFWLKNSFIGPFIVAVQSIL